MAWDMRYVVLILLLTFIVLSEANTDKKFINLKVVGVDNSEVYFKIAIKTQLKKLKQAYADRAGIPLRMLRFTFDGKRIIDTKTPNMLGMKDGDVIEVYREQYGPYSRHTDGDIW